MSFDNHRTSAVDGKSSTGNSETQSQTPAAVPLMCRTGCGFYANSAFDGMCSKCFKEVTNTQQTTSSNSGATVVSTGVQTMISSSVQQSAAVAMPTVSAATCSAESGVLAASLETGLPTVRSNVSLASRDTIDSTDTESEVGETGSDAGSDRPRKKRCAVCKKRVGLTGFDCRCGGHFCATHRYSDTHSCDFNYHALAQTEIRKHNPVVAAEKVKKI